MARTGVMDVLVPDIGDFDDVPVIEILVSSGDTVAVDDPLLTLESDKATMDVPAPYAGVVKELEVKVGDKVSQGTLLLRLETSQGGAPDAGVETKASAVESEAAPSEAAAPASIAGALQAEMSDSSEDPGAGPSAGAGASANAGTSASAGGSAGAGPAVGAGASGGAEAQAGWEHAAPAERTTNSQPSNGGPVYASPSVRRLARERGVDLARVRGSGRKGRVTKDDVESFVGDAGVGGQAAATDGTAAATAPGGRGVGIAGLELAPWPKLEFERFGAVERQPRSRIQKISAPNLARNWVMIPHVTHNDEADITELEAFRKQINEEHAKHAVKLTMVGFLIAASVATLKEFPDFNASLDGDELVRKRYYNIGFAADTPGGLVVPVIKDADKKGILGIARELSELSGKAREGKLDRSDMQGGCFTISSLGGIGGTSFTPIINAPEVAILGVTRAAVKPVWSGSEFAPRLMVPLSLSYDHRVIDGAAAARFTVHLVKVLSDLRRALL